MPDADLSQIQAVQINISADERQADQLQGLVAMNLSARGISVVTGDEAAIYGEDDYVLRMASDWRWDITWYLLDLRVAIYELKNNTLVAQAHSRQTSLVRKDTEFVVERAMASLFNDPEKSTGDDKDDTNE